MIVAISSSTLRDLITYLQDHESDIAWQVNDFGELRQVYIELVGSPPSKDLT